MASATLPEPGTEYGPCVAACEHRDCTATREQATAPCLICREPIGYDTPFYKEGDEWGHAHCVLAVLNDAQERANVDEELDAVTRGFEAQP